MEAFVFSECRGAGFSHPMPSHPTHTRPPLHTCIRPFHPIPSLCGAMQCGVMQGPTAQRIVGVGCGGMWECGVCPAWHLTPHCPIACLCRHTRSTDCSRSIHQPTTINQSPTRSGPARRGHTDISGRDRHLPPSSFYSQPRETCRRLSLIRSYSQTRTNGQTSEMIPDNT